MYTFKSIVSAAAILFSAAFVMSNSTGCSTEEVSDDELVGAAHQALTADQCEYFDVDGTIQICHSLGNGKFKILKLSDQGCINGHTSHAADYVAVGDPTCQGGGCLPEGAPVDNTVPCCDGLSAQNGVCTVVVPACPNGLTDCGGVCVDLNWDNNNCGSCGSVCSGDWFCDWGGCQNDTLH